MMGTVLPVAAGERHCQLNRLSTRIRGWNHDIAVTASRPRFISHAVFLYHRFTLSFRDVEDLLAERGILVS